MKTLLVLLMLSENVPVEKKPVVDPVKATALCEVGKDGKRHCYVIG